MSVTAVYVDNGEPLFEKSLISLKNQVNEIVVCPSSKTDLELAKKYAHTILPAMDGGIGRARVKGIEAAEGKYILSCDSDTTYDRKYADIAVQDLQMFRAVKAGSISPYESTLESQFEAVTMPLFAYEFSLAFRKDDFIRSNIHKCDYSYGLSDIGFHVLARLPPVLPDYKMKCQTRAPTRLGHGFIKEFLPAIAGIVLTIGGIAALPVLGELSKS